MGFFAKAVLEVRQGRRVAFVDEKQQVLAEYSSPSLTRLEWNARDEGRIVLPDSDFDRVVDELEKPAKPSPRLAFAPSPGASAADVPGPCLSRPHTHYQ